MPSGRPIKHPSWRVFRALEEAQLSPKDFGLRDDIVIFVPYRRIDELTEALVRALTDPNYADTSFPVKECLEIFRDVTGRQIIEGLLLADQSVQETASQLDASTDLVMTYASLFFDTSVFSNRIEKLVYVKDGTAGSDRTVKDELIKCGSEHFKAKSHLPSDKLKVDNLMADALALAYMQMVETSKSEEKHLTSVNWGNLFVKIAAQMQKKGGGTSLKDFQVMLQSDDQPLERIEDLD